MDERLPFGDFYRPIGNLSLAVDYAVWGLEPFGFQLTSMVVYCATVVLMYLASRKMLGSRSWLGPALAALFLGLHPSVLAVLPFPARRCQMLMLFFTLASILVLPVGPTRGIWWRSVAAGFLALLAIGSNEAGVIAVGMILLHQLLFGFDGRLGRSVIRAFLATIPAVLAISVYMVNRFVVIGGMGGYHPAASQSYVDNVIAWIPKYVSLMLCTIPFEDFGMRVLVATCAAAVLGASGFWLVVSGERAHEKDVRRAGRLVPFAVTWVVVGLLFAGLSMQFAVRYVVLPSAGVAMLLAALGERVILMGRRAALPAAGILLVMICALWSSPLLTSYSEFRVATQIQSGVLAGLEKKLKAANVGDRVEHQIHTRVKVSSRLVDDAWMLESWSIPSWLEMEFPGRRILVREKSRQLGGRSDSYTITLEFTVRDGKASG
ncbi:MAG: hypothetical protein JXQ75_09790 [Phycisphaerae bacterium]|nr:hypothetical protein [Phycisphaerae bacterium]